ncbi:hypothetical protein EGR_10370 [Echinococcus granulosus]|uniref:Uncharacterized protein n=1 Tax=Echinococcus granulosus TaxID=6210 RepID=W6U2J2_ECHGR|nr:hypothetical protein EGR_10370 [Echinococcus granulosus]EUB54771.1 hypothetical protein EGR_10370 [Echinococcus granulosus]
MGGLVDSSFKLPDIVFTETIFCYFAKTTISLITFNLLEVELSFKQSHKKMNCKLVSWVKQNRRRSKVGKFLLKFLNRTESLWLLNPDSITDEENAIGSYFLFAIFRLKLKA